jgi:hypothetical protein
MREGNLRCRVGPLPRAKRAVEKGIFYPIFAALTREKGAGKSRFGRK